MNPAASRLAAGRALPVGSVLFLVGLNIYAPFLFFFF